MTVVGAAKRPAKLTAKERHALRELAKPVGKRDYSRVHGRSIDALERKGLFGCNGKPGGALTPAGRAELIVPNIFDDLFGAKEQKAMAKTKTAKKTVETRPAIMTNDEIDAHPLLDPEQRRICKGLRNAAKSDGSSFTMLAFAEISLRATGNNYADVTDQGGHEAARCDYAHRRAAILYVYEAIKAGPAIVAETAGDRGTLRDLELLASHL